MTRGRIAAVLAAGGIAASVTFAGVAWAAPLTLTSPAFADGAAIRYYELNDAYASKSSGAVHPSDHIGACLAVAEAEKASAADAALDRLQQYKAERER